MKVITLIENTTESELICEHGLSFYIEYNGKAYLLDAGQSALFKENAKALGLNLDTVDKAVLSHAHYDHAGGFDVFVNENKHAQVYMQKSACFQCFSEKAGGMKDIGIPKQVRDSLEGRIRYVEGDMCIADGVYLIAHHKEGLAERGKQMHMYVRENGRDIYDNFSHEQSLVFEAESGLVVFNSCCHGGVDLILEEVQQAFKGRRILAMFGGFHLMGADGPESMRQSRDQVIGLGEKLRDMSVDRLYTGHCTGTKAYPILKEILGERLDCLTTGKILEFS